MAPENVNVGSAVPAMPQVPALFFALPFGFLSWSQDGYHHRGGLTEAWPYVDREEGVASCGSQFSNEKTFSPSPRPLYLPYTSPLQTFPSSNRLRQKQSEISQIHLNHSGRRGQGSKISLLPVRGRSGFWMPTTRDCQQTESFPLKRPAL